MVAPASGAEIETTGRAGVVYRVVGNAVVEVAGDCGRDGSVAGDLPGLVIGPEQCGVGDGDSHVHAGAAATPPAVAAAACGAGDRCGRAVAVPSACIEHTFDYMPD